MWQTFPPGEHTWRMYVLPNVVVSSTTFRQSCANFTGFRFASASSTMVYKCLHGLAPPYLTADCVPVTSVASRRHLRSVASGCLAVTGTRTTLGGRNFAVTGATIWNNLPADLRLHSQSLLSFGQKLKQYLFEP